MRTRSPTAAPDPELQRALEAALGAVSARWAVTLPASSATRPAQALEGLADSLAATTQHNARFGSEDR